jgi:coenzyme F420-reducing hydrogenase beta subunit
MNIKRIVEGGYCIGCGACSAAVDHAIAIVMDEYGKYQLDISDLASLSEEALHKATYVCPFSDCGPDEDALGELLFSEARSFDSRIGYFKSLYVGHVAEDDFRSTGTSGGIITWALTELLEKGEIDAAVHVKKVGRPKDGILFRYGFSRTVKEIKSGAKSRYYPIEMSSILTTIKRIHGRYAVVGVPCFIKAVRLLAQKDPVINERVVYCIGLVCGHLKSKAFADCLGWQVGIPPGRLEDVDFRVKLPNRTASDYGVFLRGAGKETTRPTCEFFGSNWGYNFFRYPACDYCDDVFAETADMVVGDAWLPEFRRDPRGTSLVAIRTAPLLELFVAAQRKGRIHLTPSTPDEIAASQAGGLRDRRDGLAYRLHLKERKGEWAPRKRVLPSKAGSYALGKIYQSRSAMRAASHSVWVDAVCRNSFDLFEKRLEKMIVRHRRLSSSLLRRCASRLKTVLLRLFKDSAKP